MYEKLKKEGDIVILDLAYNAFDLLYRHHTRGGFFAVREKNCMKMKVIGCVAKKNLPKNIISDETILPKGCIKRRTLPCTWRYKSRNRVRVCRLRRGWRTIRDWRR